MALPASGAISIGDVSVELGRAATATTNLNESAVRALFGLASGAIDMNTGHGKSNRTVRNIVVSSNSPGFNLSSFYATNITSGGVASSGPAYTAGTTDIIITINSGVILYGYTFSTYPNYPANIGGVLGNTLVIDGSGLLTAGDTVKIINNGYIAGTGAKRNSDSGHTAIETTWPITIDNTNGYIAGGGGGGGSGEAGYTTGFYSYHVNGGQGGGGAGLNHITPVFSAYPNATFGEHGLGTRIKGGNGGNRGLGGNGGMSGTSNGYHGSRPPAGGGFPGYSVQCHGNALTWIGGSTRIFGDVQA